MFQILVVEDDKKINQSICSFLNRNGYEATGCLSASEAYDAMYLNVFDLIISDIMMPEIDGFEFAKNSPFFERGYPHFVRHRPR